MKFRYNSLARCSALRVATLHNVGHSSLTAMDARCDGGTASVIEGISLTHSLYHSLTHTLILARFLALSFSHSFFFLSTLFTRKMVNPRFVHFLSLFFVFCKHFQLCNVANYNIIWNPNSRRYSFVSYNSARVVNGTHALQYYMP